MASTLPYRTTCTEHADECPDCHSRESKLIRDGGAYDGHEFRCRSCGQEWTAVFEFTHAETDEAL